MEREAPAQIMVVGNVTAEAAQDHARVDRRLMHTHRAASRGARVVIRDQCQRGGYVEGLAETHQRARPQQLVVAGGVAREPCHHRPGGQASDDGHAAPQAIGDQSSQRTQERVHPLELPQHEAPVRVGLHACHILHHRELHRGEHLAIEVVQQRHRPQQRHGHPGKASGAGKRRRAAHGPQVWGEHARPVGSVSVWRQTAEPMFSRM